MRLHDIKTGYLHAGDNNNNLQDNGTIESTECLQFIFTSYAIVEIIVELNDNNGYIWHCLLLLLF